MSRQFLFFQNAPSNKIYLVLFMKYIQHPFFPTKFYSLYFDKVAINKYTYISKQNKWVRFFIDLSLASTNVIYSYWEYDFGQGRNSSINFLSNTKTLWRKPESSLYLPISLYIIYLSLSLSISLSIYPHIYIKNYWFT